MAGRASGPPRRPRNPVARAVRGPAFRQRIVPDKRRSGRQPKDWRQEDQGHDPEPPPESVDDTEKDPG